MQKIFVLACLLSTSSFAQSAAENELLKLVNFCRQQPTLFLDSIMLPYLNSNAALKNLKESKSLVRTLRKQKPLSPLVFAEDLNRMAEKYAKEKGAKGYVGHRNFTKRFKSNSVKYAVYGENCSYGFDTPIDILMQLLIDENVPDLGHRKNILSKEYKYIGISIQPHRKTTWTCVMEFGG